MTYIEKHVEFTDDLNNNENNKEYNQQQQKLHRRDTPHHLKNKRIINKNNDSITLDVNFSLKKKKSHFNPFCFFFFQQIMSHSPTRSSIASGGKEV